MTIQPYTGNASNFLPPQFRNTDFSQFSNWPTQEFNGQPFYQIPGSPSDWFDPRTNQVYSTTYLDQLQNQNEVIAKQQNAALHPPGLASQLGTLAAGGLTAIGAQQLGQGHLPFGLGNLFGGSTTPGTPATAPTSSGGIGNWISNLFGGSSSSTAPTVVNAAPGSAPAIPTGLSGSFLGNSDFGPVASGDTYGSFLGGGLGGFLGGGGTSGIGPVASGDSYASMLGGGAGDAAGGGFGLMDAIPYAAIPLGAYEAFKGFQNKNTGQAALGGAATGAGIGFEVGGPIGAGIGAGVGGLFGLGSSLQGGKSKDEKARSAERDALAASGFADRGPSLGGGLTEAQVKENPTGTYVPLADGSWFDISKAASGKEYNVSEPDKPYTAQAALWANPISHILVGKDPKSAEQLAASLVNAISSNTNDPLAMQKNAQSIFDRLHMTPEQASQAIDQEISNKMISSEEGAVYKQGLQTLFGKDPTKFDAQPLEVRMKANENGTPEPLVQMQSGLGPTTSSAADALRKTPFIMNV